MGLERLALESELGRKSTDFRARKRSRAHLKRTHGALQRTVGRRLRGEKPAERRAGPDRRSGARRSAQAWRSAARQSQGERAERCGSRDGRGARRQSRRKGTGCPRAGRSFGIARSVRATRRAIEAGHDAGHGSPSGSSGGSSSGSRSNSTRASGARRRAASRSPCTCCSASGADLSTPPSPGRAAVDCEKASACGSAGSVGLGVAWTANGPSRASWRSAAPR
jgi:hypothetical protein